jgi:hypothetical protein
VKAVVINAPGGPEQLVVAEVPEPSFGPGEVLVDVHTLAATGRILRNVLAFIRMRAPIRWCRA